MSKQIGVIGDKESILPFKLFGFTVRFGIDAATTEQAFAEMIAADFQIIYITEDCAVFISEQIEKYQNHLSPAIVLIPTHAGTNGFGKQQIQKNMEKAVGQNIL